MFGYSANSTEDPFPTRGASLQPYSNAWNLVPSQRKDFPVGKGVLEVIGLGLQVSPLLTMMLSWIRVKCLWSGDVPTRSSKPV